MLQNVKKNWYSAKLIETMQEIRDGEDNIDIPLNYGHSLWASFPETLALLKCVSMNYKCVKDTRIFENTEHNTIALHLKMYKTRKVGFCSSTFFSFVSELSPEKYFFKTQIEILILNFDETKFLSSANYSRLFQADLQMKNKTGYRQKLT